MEKKCGEFYGCGEKNGTVQHINACPLSHSTKDVELERPMNSNEAYQVNHGYTKCQHCSAYIHQIITQAYNLGKEEERKKLDNWCRERMGYLDVPNFKTKNKSTAIYWYDKALIDTLSSIGENKGEV